MQGGKNEERLFRRFFQHFEKGVACRRVHGVSVGYYDHTQLGLVRFQRKCTAERTDLIDSDEWAGRFDVDDVRVVPGFNFPARLANAARANGIPVYF